MQLVRNLNKRREILLATPSKVFGIFLCLKAFRVLCFWLETFLAVLEAFVLVGVIISYVDEEVEKTNVKKRFLLSWRVSVLTLPQGHRKIQAVVILLSRKLTSDYYVINRNKVSTTPARARLQSTMRLTRWRFKDSDPILSCTTSMTKYGATRCHASDLLIRSVRPV